MKETKSSAKLKTLRSMVYVTYCSICVHTQQYLFKVQYEEHNT